MWAAQEMHDLAIKSKEERKQRAFSNLKDFINTQIPIYAARGNFNMKVNIEDICEFRDIVTEFIQWVQSYGYRVDSSSSSNFIKIFW